MLKLLELPRRSFFGPSGGKSDALNPFLMVPRASFDQKIEMLKIRRRLIRSMRNRISYSVAVAVTPEAFQNNAFFIFFPFGTINDVGRVFRSR